MRFAFPLFAVSILCLSCCQDKPNQTFFPLPGLVGNGVAASDDRKVAAFSELKIETVCKVEIAEGKETSVTVSADENLLPIVTTEVSDGILRIGTSKSFSSQQGIKVKITVSGLAKVQAASASEVNIGKATCEEFELNLSGASKGAWKGEAKKLTLKISGASQAKLQGTVENLFIDCTGASTVKAFETIGTVVTVRASGACTVEVAPKSKLDAKAEGASTVVYSTKPETLEVSETGASKVKQK